MTNTPDLEILGLISTQHASETHAAKSTWIDKAYLAAHAKAHEYAGFDRVLIGYNAASPDGFQVAAYAAAQTTKLKFLLAHRPGVTAPTVAARQLATLDQLSDGRLAVHIITGGSDEEQRRDGDYLTKAERYARTDDYITVLKKALENDGPFDHEGPYYKVEGAPAAVKSLQQPRLPIFFGGASDEAVDVASRQADVYALFGETLEQAAEIVGRVRDGAKAHGRDIKFSMSLRPIIARTEDEAWAKAARILDDAKALKEARGGASRYVTARGGQRLIEAAQGGAVRDKRELFERSDDVVLAAPATPETFHLVNRKLLAHAKPGLHLINVARGALIDDEALLWALDEGRVGLASLDVTHPEPLPFNHAYYTHPRVRLSPHTSVHTPDTRRNLAAQFAENLHRFRQGAPLDGVVDLARGY